MMNFKTIAIALISVSLTTGALAAETVYSWRQGSHNAYSDIPLNLRMDYANKMNVRTHTVSASTDAKLKTPDSLAQRQLELSQQIAAENKKVEDENAKRTAEAAKIKEENCQQARSNLNLAQNARNKDQLIPKYTNDISRFCN